MTDTIGIPQTITVANGANPRCDICGEETRLYGIEPHPRHNHTDVRTYACDACDTTQVVTMPLSA